MSENLNKIYKENYYFFTINGNVTIDGGPKRNVARFMNHSCEPNCQTGKWLVKGLTRIGLFALHETNTELTFNYKLECAGKNKKKLSLLHKILFWLYWGDKIE
jgi:SET domain-containing protein